MMKKLNLKLRYKKAKAYHKNLSVVNYISSFSQGSHRNVIKTNFGLKLNSKAIKFWGLNLFLLGLHLNRGVVLKNKNMEYLIKFHLLLKRKKKVVIIKKKQKTFVWNKKLFKRM